ncbi:MAG: DUF4837 family protein [Tenacibaculum sp.]|nr:DUF4837 family protein [Tenacibaculum sp.]
MKKILLLLTIVFLATNCNSDKKNDKILRSSVGSTNTILTVTKSSLWTTKVGDEIRSVFGEHQVGLPQPETLVSMGQVDPSGFTNIMNNNRSIMVVSVGDKKEISVSKNVYASPQTIVYVTGKDELDLIDLIHNRGSEIIKIFKDSEIKFRQNIFSEKKLDEQKFETIKKLGISLTIPNNFRLVKDSIGFLWLRQHLKSGIARGDGNNNILIYSYPLKNSTSISNNITLMRDKIGEIHIPGSKEGMYMITEKAYTPFTFDAEIDGKKAYETRGKWEVKNDFMAGPFINYTIIDKKRNRIIVFEGFTYAPSVNKRDFIFELEAIGKSMKIN